MEGTRERPLCRAEVFTGGGGEAQTVFTVSPSAHIPKATCDIIGRKQVGKICQVFRLVKDHPSSPHKEPAGPRSKDRLMVMDWGGQGCWASLAGRG